MIYFEDLAMPGGLPDAWWFENHTRLQKFLVVAMTLEGDNLRQLKNTKSSSGTKEASTKASQAEPDDIPQTLMHIQKRVHELRATKLAKMKEEYKALVKEMRKLEVGYVEMFTRAK